MTSSAEKVRIAAKKAQDLIVKSTGGWKDEESLRELRGLVEEIRFHSGGNGYVSEKLAGLLSFSDMFYSQRKWHKYETADQSGLERVRSICYSYAGSIQTWVTDLASSTDDL